MTNIKRIKSMRTSWISLKCCVVQTLLFWGRSNLVTLVRFMEVNIWYNHNNKLERNNKMKFKIWKLGFSRRHRLAAMGVLLEGNIFLSFETQNRFFIFWDSKQRQSNSLLESCPMQIPRLADKEKPIHQCQDVYCQLMWNVNNVNMYKVFEDYLQINQSWGNFVTHLLKLFVKSKFLPRWQFMTC